MEQETLQVAARKYCEDKFKDGEYSIGIKEIREQCELDFCAGAEWQRKQPQWISADDRLPDVDKSGESEYVLVRYKDCIPIVAQYCTEEFHCCPSFIAGRKKCISHWIDTKSNWIGHEITHWMPIPKFNGILEENRDVLKRIKEKGD